MRPRICASCSARQSDTVPSMNALNGGNPDRFDGVPAQSLTSLRLGIKRGGIDVSPLMRGVDELALEVGHLHFGVADVVGRNFEQVAIQHDDLRRFAGLDRAGVLFQL